MLSLRAFSNATQRVRYFLQDSGLEAAEKRGFWIGKGAEAIGLEPNSRVSKDAFHSVLQGYDPRSGRFLGQRYHFNRRAGWDMVLTPHKSLSVAALCTRNASASKRIREAWHAATLDTFPLIERLAQSHYQGRVKLPTDGLVGAGFTHLRSRHGDPLLHTHFVIANATQCRAQKDCWRSLEPVAIFRHSGLLDLAFQRELLRHLTDGGILAALDPKGRVMLPDLLPDAVLGRLSKAREAINAAEEAQSPPPLALSTHGGGLNRANYRNRLNDRLRPDNIEADRYPSFDSMLSEQEHDALASSLQRLMPRRKRTQEVKPVAAPEVVVSPAFDRSTSAPDRQPDSQDLSLLRGELALRLGEKYLFTHPKLRFATWLESARSRPQLALRQMLLPLDEWGGGIVTHAFTPTVATAPPLKQDRRNAALRSQLIKRLEDPPPVKVGRKRGHHLARAKLAVEAQLNLWKQQMRESARKQIVRFRSLAGKRGGMVRRRSPEVAASVMPDLTQARTSRPKR